MIGKRYFLSVVSLLFLAACTNGDAKFPALKYAEREEFYSDQADPNNIRLNVNVLQQQLANGEKGLSVKLPLPEGGFTEFHVIDSGTMPLRLAQRYPRIHSLKGRDVQGRRLRLDIYENSLQAMVFDSRGNWVVQPIDGPDKRRYQSLSLDVPRKLATTMRSLSGSTAPLSMLTSDIDNIQRNYRIAVASTSDFTRKYGTTVDAGLARVIRSINRVNEVFERDFSIHLVLVENNDKIIFNDPASDPYANVKSTRKTNVSVLNAAIGKENFDIGHLLERDIGGGTTDGTVCQDDKADGASGSATPSEKGEINPPNLDISDGTFDVLLAHELAHQFNASHTFNGCSRDGSIGFEPGSGSTIMSYAGQCFISTEFPPKENLLHTLQRYKNWYFHAVSIDQVKAFTSTGAGSACGTKRQDPVLPPHIDPVSTAPFGAGTLTIPALTPFALRGYAQSSKPKAGYLTYAWEQFDLGSEQPEAQALSDVGQGPIFRSYPPNLSGERIFPRLSAVLGEEPLGLGEVYPATTRVLNFRLTVRDNAGDLSSAAMLLNVFDTGRPFAIKSATNSVPWKSGESRDVFWDVAATDRPPIACQTVDIDLSLDGGHTYQPRPLAAAVSNQGSAKIIVPALTKDTATARLRVSCTQNLFFAVSRTNFDILK